MINFLILFLLCNSTTVVAQNISTVFEQSGGKETPDYATIISWWKKLDLASDKVKLFTMGPTDAGYPLHLALVSTDKDFNIASLHKKQKSILLINNGIHPGEPDGIDASMLLARDIATGKMALPENIVLAIIPVYNIGGCLNRSANYRVDQNGPEEFGFRGNSQNLDLNRDFIKNDSKEARSFARIFHFLDPDILIDNHVSDGADYQHVISLLSSQHNKLGGPLGAYLNNTLEPAIYSLMKEKGYDLVPYVNAFEDTPESGWPEFFDSPRFSSGYAALWGTLAFMPETHMLKPFAQRVRATYALMECFIRFTHENAATIRTIRNQTKSLAKSQNEFPISWEPDRDKYKEIDFRGFAVEHKPSNISGQPRLYYDRSRPFEKNVKFYNEYKPGIIISKPVAYIIPQGWWKVIEILKANQVNMIPFLKDTMVEVEIYHVEDYKSLPRAYEGHHINSAVKTSIEIRKMSFRKGDYSIPMNQAANRYLMEVLEPQGGDSFFAWNFFDAILGQKEGYSDYVFEETAEEYLKNHPELQAKLAKLKAADSAFAKNGRAQLNFIFKNSPYYEPDHLRYPVYRVTH